MSAPSASAPAASAASAGLSPARVAFDADGTPCAPDYGDVYHTAAGAFAQARHVFLAGNGLPGRWQGRERFVILETGFGLGNNFLATWAAWRADPQRCERLVFISLEKHPLTPGDLARVHRASEETALAAELVAQWPPLTPDLHALDFEGGRVQLLLVFGDALQTLPGLQAEADALYLDGFAPSRNAELWSAELFRRLARLVAPGATAATWSAARAVRDGLASIGFAVERAPGFGGKRDITVARHAPRFVPPRPAAWRPPHAGPRQALVIGAGLAGAAAAHGLLRQGWQVEVIDRQAAPAAETSGNPGGLMHGIFNAPDSLHARWFRAAALRTARLAAPALASGRVAGRLDGFLRLEPRLDEARARGQLAAVGLPADWIAWQDAEAAAAFSGLTGDEPCGGWQFRQGGWLSPADWSRHLLQGATFRGGLAVQRLQRENGLWQALDADGRVLAAAPVLVVAAALGSPALLQDRARLPLVPVRGQTTVLPAGWPGLRVRPSQLRPLSGQGYALALPDGRVLTGATTQHDDPDPQVRAADHRHNLQRAQRLGLVAAGAALASLDDQGDLDGRVGWRAVTPDRLPLAGPPVDEAALAAAASGRQRLDALRLRPRLHDGQGGLYLLTGLGSRGLASAALAGEVLATWITGAPCPVAADLRDAIDPARRTG
ncbi:FAD-dependent 5-carboxymethylaminomethyl-2-thiouridine(34) oxidoreductase MnmC [Sphaerotilus uruguayifluvii]|uniref:tRNA 5-methylaminomethyl-2-thiouridine biosynthesis bifunctional protein MnmC n=1 Tax=Sphaerotilus uruguayifluvii TaxID=2735897 RepID=A0ABX2G3X3_9BURK|nr:FAD-dependent 5-carboxymethylaminomethyl-2-thiouridine(34) oxidoreductase MnmC [Leptothrix sp. C29]NRT56153.1 tRNA 5-methylaminomethyl-2-thiouridine biosynthesis bifunctional protein [Leptothrix sp. C29]